MTKNIKSISSVMLLGHTTVAFKYRINEASFKNVSFCLFLGFTSNTACQHIIMMQPWSKYIISRLTESFSNHNLMHLFTDLYNIKLAVFL